MNQFHEIFSKCKKKFWYCFFQEMWLFCTHRKSAIFSSTWQGSSWTLRRSSRLRLQLESRILLLLATGWGGSGQSHGVHPEPQGVQDLLPGVFQTKSFLSELFALFFSLNIWKQEYKIALPSYFTDQGKEAKYWEFQVRERFTLNVFCMLLLNVHCSF